jgi:hypothetical protein
MATQEFQYIEDILKEWYAPAIVNQVYVKSPVWSQVKKTSKGVAGKRVYIPLRHTLSEAVGGLQANEYTLMTANRVLYDSSTIYQKRNYGRVQVDGLAIEAGKGKGGWIDAFSGETKSIAEAFALEIDQQVMGRGTAILGVCSAADSSKVQAVDNPHGITEATPGYMWFRKNMTVSFWNVGSSAYIPTAATSGYNVASITPGSNQITLTTSPATATADGDFIVRTNSASFDTSDDTTIDAHATGNGVIMGIDRIVDNDQTNYAGDDIDSFQGIDGNAAAQNWWRATVQSSRGILTETKIQEDLDEIEKNTDGEAPNLALTTYAIRNKLIEIVKSDRMISTLNLVGGWEAIKYRGGSVSLPIMVHKFNPTGYIYYLNLKYLKFYTLKKLVWDSSGGGVIKPVSGEDQYEAWFKMYGNLGTDKRNAMGKGIGYTVS